MSFQPAEPDKHELPGRDLARAIARDLEDESFPRLGETTAETSSSKPEPVESLRSRLRDVATEIPGLDTLIELIAEACKPVIKVRMQGHECPKGLCKKCPHVWFAEIPNQKAMIEALKFVLEQTEGRPGQANVDDAGVVIRRVVVMADDSDKLAALVEMARQAKTRAAAPDYDDDAVTSALWDLVDAVIVAG